MTAFRWVPPWLLLAGGASALEAQEFLDRGAFVIARGGAETGRVEYAVRFTTGQQGQGGLQTVATTRTPAHEVQSVLETDKNLAPVSYQSIESSGGRVSRRVSAQIAGARFSARASTDAGDVARELPVRPPFAILGDEDYTVFYFIPRPDSGATRTLNLVRTRDLSATTGTVTGGGNDTVTVAGRPVVARRFELRLADGEVRQFWMTPAGSLVQVALPAAGLIATRTEAPAQ
jgi:hypothetical protein